MEKLEDFFGEAVGVNYNHTPRGLILREPGADLPRGFRDMGEEILYTVASETPYLTLLNPIFHTRQRPDNSMLYKGWIEGVLIESDGFSEDCDYEEIGFSPSFSSFSRVATYEPIKTADWVCLNPAQQKILAIGAS